MRVMAWNLENFKLDADWTMPHQTPFLLSAIYPDAAHPNTPAVDVFGVIEVYNRAGGGPPGRPLPLGSLGGQGCLRLLRELVTRNNANTNWRLVPPLSLGDTRRDEAVGVFYNAAKVAFEGPNQWDSMRRESLPTPRVTMPGALPIPWQEARISVPPHYYTARVRFYTDIEYKDEITFPDDAHRRPCLVRFKERDAPRHLVDIFFFHTSPPLKQDPNGAQNPAFLACRYLETVREIHKDSMRRGVDRSVVIGDFNVNANVPKQFDDSLGEMLAVEYGALLPARDNNVRAAPTMMRDREEVTLPDSPIPDPVCGETYWRQFAIDNALYRPKGSARIGAALDRTKGTATFATWPSVMAETIAEIHAWPTAVVRWQKFTSSVNWYQNRQRSDHVPVVIEI